MTAMADSKPKMLQVMPQTYTAAHHQGGLGCFETLHGSVARSSQFNKYIPCMSLTERVQLVKRTERKHEACFGGDVALSSGDSRLLLQYREVISGLGFKTGYQSGNQPLSIDCQV